MYPHWVDRHSVLQTIIRRYREVRKLSQHDIANATGVSQSTISGYENKLAEREDVGRELLIRILSYGLKLSPSEIDALLWLADGEPLAPSELEQFMESGPVGHHLEQDLRHSVLDCLQYVLERHDPNERPEVKTWFNADDRMKIAEMEELAKLEALPGQRLVITKYPQSLTDPNKARHRLLTTAGARAFARELTADRRRQFLVNLESYGERSIHSKTALTRYINGEATHRLLPDERRSHVRHWIELLKQYPKYEIGLVDTTPQLEVAIKSTKAAVIRGAPRDEDYRKASAWGLHHVFWYDETSVLMFLLDFERNWLDIPDEDRSKDAVVAWLNDEIRRSSRSKH